MMPGREVGTLTYLHTAACLASEATPGLPPLCGAWGSQSHAFNTWDRRGRRTGRAAAWPD
eukprot:97923-Chlamydomonas_euryale.AAC.3